MAEKDIDVQTAQHVDSEISSENEKRFVEALGGTPAPYLPVVGGDFAIRCIAAASVLAKVSRDHVMEELEEKYPGYGLGKHKGYGTAVHTEAIKTLGATAIHRMSYSNVAHAHLEFEMTKM